MDIDNLFKNGYVILPTYQCETCDKLKNSLIKNLMKIYHTIISKGIIKLIYQTIVEILRNYFES